MDSEELVRRSRAAGTHDEFRRRVAAQATRLREALASGAFDGGYALGLELEGYAVDPDGRLATIPDAAFASTCERELGRHNAEVNTPATGFDPAGIDRGTTALRDRVETVASALAPHDRRFVTDGIWTLAPPEGALAYLTDETAVGDLTVPRNMSPKARYYALDADITAEGPVELDVPGCRRSFPSILVESLATSTQVHLQPPVDDLADCFAAAVRTAGPVLALAANAPFLPPDLYTDPDPEAALAAGVELRVPTFESMNVRDPGKVRLPRDLADATTAVDRVVDDRRCAPLLREWTTDDPREGFVDDYWEFLHKASTCWRWVRPVFGPGGPRIEYRLPAAQPSVPDVVALQALVAGLVHGTAVTDHPLADLPWAAARDSLYAAARDGFDADLAWLTRDGQRVDDAERVYPDLFALARAGLSDRGFDDGDADGLLAPLEARWDRRTTPATWKRDRVRERLAAGDEFDEAVEATGREYVERTGTPFVEW
jgi:hypothetical protein